MILNEFTDYIEKNLNRILGLNIIHSASEVFHHLANELKISDETLNRLTEKEYLSWYEHLFKTKFLLDILEENQNFCEIIVHNNNDASLFLMGGISHSFQIQLSQRMINLSIEILTVLHKKQFNDEHPFASFQLNLSGENYRISLNHLSTSSGISHSIYLRKLSNIAHAPISRF